MRGESPTPLFDRIAREGIRFERCYAPRGQTHPSLASMLTGNYPITHGLRANGLRLSSRHVPLPVLLEREGYRTAGFCANLDKGRWPFWIRGLDVAEDGIDGALLEEGYDQEFRFQREWDERVVEKAIRWIESIPPADAAPIFLWVHLYDAHQPYTPAAGDAARFVDADYSGPLREPNGPPDAPKDGVTPYLDAWTLGEGAPTVADVEHVRHLYDAGVRGCDDRLARIFSVLEARGHLEDALVVYTSDHGDELGDHHVYFGHGNSIYDSVLRIPLALSWRNRVAAGRVTDALVQNLDLFATLLEAAGAAPPVNEGSSLLPIALGSTDRSAREHVFAEWEDSMYSVSDGTSKLIQNPRGVQPRKPPFHRVPGRGFPYACFELYDLRTDPLEQANVYAPDDPRAVRLREVLRAFLARAEHRDPMQRSDEIDPALEALGYVGAPRREKVLTIDCGDER